MHFKHQLAALCLNDTDLCVYGPQVTTSNIQMAMQELVDHWEGLLHATEGALVLTKCFGI